ncbi:putative small molecule transporter [Trachipleistophora hominis]|uniref:Putative small molecule transporter n=1 Tax=Trachipleistophora hominis TaxID=72359 RepID=L7JX06_TRAHO|nr:putative small molecule transporter [Trachipleistophora hominis]
MPRPRSTQLPIPRPRSTQLPIPRPRPTQQERQRQKQQEQRQEQEQRNKSALLRVKPIVPKTKQKTRRIAAVRRQSAYNEVNYDYITEDQEFETSHELEENDALPRTHTFLNLGLIKLHYTVHKKKRATMEFIKVLNQIINYQRINYALLEHCIAKRRTSRRVKRNELQPLIKQSYFYRSKEAAVLLKDVKRLYRQRFVKNDKNAGRLFRRLRRRDRPKAVCVFASGVLITVNAFFMFSGVACREGVCALLPFLRGAQCSAAYDPYTPQLFFSLLFVGFYLFGVSLLIFTWKKINHPFIFSFNLDSHMEVSRYFVCTAALHLLYNAINALPIDAKASFALAMCAVGACIVLPLDVLYRKSRYYVVYCVLKIVCTPAFKVRFRHFFFTDYLQSFAIVYRKVLGCFFTLGPVSVFFIGNYGNLVRVMQCGRRYYDKPERVHIYNAGKYVCQIMFSILTITYVHVQDGRTAHKNARILFVLKYLRLVVGILASSFSFVWDVRVDWGLGRKNLLFAKSTLAVLIVFNLVGRYLWLLSAYLSDFFVCVYEIVRRTNWGIVRVEYEHLNNCDQLKTTSTIKLSGDLFYRKNKRAEDMSGHESTHDEKEESMV